MMDTQAPAVVDWVQIVRGEFNEMPGMHLTRSQVRRLWGLDDWICTEVLQSLMDQRFLSVTPDGYFVRGHDASSAA